MVVVEGVGIVVGGGSGGGRGDEGWFVVGFGVVLVLGGGKGGGGGWGRLQARAKGTWNGGCHSFALVGCGALLPLYSVRCALTVFVGSITVFSVSGVLACLHWGRVLKKAILYGDDGLASWLGPLPTPTHTNTNTISTFHQFTPLPLVELFLFVLGFGSFRRNRSWF